ncbi:probable pre-mRNA-splicing factor ATP-dependent RNA helicase mog-1 [Cotesia glomerata]|uniref:probable pre-mRNA-splicing factor ATP-dependent RNA helicase mog-1 n=1 Tax=Cotesia glomerata TaxID=32391 RepID=UPI001D00E6C1|nr:probable pre-mRNA-splicing factor ATP-dependent RNA helicase mog-1 [Cotesia glomerata]
MTTIRTSQNLEALLNPLLSRLVVLATKTGCSAEHRAVIIVSMQTILTKLYSEPELDNKRDMALAKFRVVESDQLTLLSMYKSWESHEFSSVWCARNGIKYADMVKVLELQIQLTAILWRHKILLFSCGIQWLVVLKCISVTYFHQSAQLVNADEGRYDSCQAGVSWYIYRNSAVMSLGFLPTVVVYDHLVSTEDRIYMRGITTIDAD